MVLHWGGIGRHGGLTTKSQVNQSPKREPSLEHKLFDLPEWLPCGVGILKYRANEKAKANRGLYVTKSGVLDLLYVSYQWGTLAAVAGFATYSILQL